MVSLPGQLNTFDLKPAKGTGYAVSLFGHEQTHDVLDPASVKAYVELNRNILRKQNVHFGVWYEDGTWYYDVTTIVKSKRWAEELGRRNRQKGIYDLAREKTIFLT